LLYLVRMNENLKLDDLYSINELGANQSIQHESDLEYYSEKY